VSRQARHRGEQARGHQSAEATDMQRLGFGRRRAYYPEEERRLPRSSDWAVGLATVRTRTLAGSGWSSGGGEAQVAAQRLGGSKARSVISMERLACESACVSSGYPCGPDWKVHSAMAVGS
jgi:hypothetical protein